MTTKVTQRRIRIEDCAHPDLQHSSLDKNAERRRRAEKQKAVSQGEQKIKKLLKRATKALLTPPAHSAAGFAEASMLFARAQAAAQDSDFKGAEFEEKVARDQDAVFTSVKFWCDTCGLRGEFDTVKPPVAKECKSSADAVKRGQYDKNAAIAPRIFGAGTQMHLAVPAGQAAIAKSKFPPHSMKGKVQEH